MHSINVIMYCYRCKSNSLVNDRKSGDLICQLCGEIIISRMINEEREWNNYEDDDDSSARAANVDSKYGSSLTNFIGGSEEQRKRLEKCQMMTLDSKELTILQNLHIIKDFSTRLNLTTQMQIKAQELFGEAIEKDHSGIRHKDALSAACLHIACRIEGYPRTIEEISEACNIDKSIIMRLQASLIKDLNLPVMTTPPSCLISRIGSRLKLSGMLLEQSRQLCDKICLLGILDSLSPQAIATTTILIICMLQDEGINIEELAQSGSCSIQSIKKIYQLIRPHLSRILLSKDLKIHPIISLSLIPFTIDKSTINQIKFSKQSLNSPSSSTNSSNTSDKLNNKRKRPPSLLFTAFYPADNVFDNKKIKSK